MWYDLYCVFQFCVVMFFSDGMAHERARTFIQQMEASHVSQRHQTINWSLDLVLLLCTETRCFW